MEEVARILNYKSAEIVRRLIKSNKIPVIRVGGRYLIIEETLQELLRGEIQPEDDE